MLSYGPAILYLCVSVQIYIFEDYRKNIYDARQQKIVREGVTEYLGSETYANMIEGLVMVMIVVILSIIIIGPKEFPVILKKMGSWIGSIKKYEICINK